MSKLIAIFAAAKMAMSLLILLCNLFYFEGGGEVPLLPVDV